jgi:hypothetical protein
MIAISKLSFNNLIASAALIAVNTLYFILNVALNDTRLFSLISNNYDKLRTKKQLSIKQFINKPFTSDTLLTLL